MHIAMVGSGYVGLVSGACLADFGHNVICIDSDGQKIEALKAGKMPIFEPGLHDIVGNNVRQSRLSFSTDLATAVAARSGLHRGRNAVAARRRPCRSLLCLPGRARDRRRPRGLYGGRDEIDRSGRHGRRSRADHPRDPAGRRIRGRFQPGVSARRRGDRRFQAARPHRHRRRGRTRRKR